MTALGRELSGDLSREALRALLAGERFRLRVAGVSMRPILLEGDEVVAERTAGPDWHLGDILVIDLPGAGLVVHRVLWTSGTAIRTRGDGSGRMDAPVALERVLGRIVQVRRDGRDVAEGVIARRLAWGRHFAAAALHRLGRRMGLGPRGSGRQGDAL
jgi:hypothetical protein